MQQQHKLNNPALETQSSSTGILLVINNGYTALDPSCNLAHRCRQDTHEIDGIVVAGCYFHSDTFDSYFLWPIDYVPINIHRPFTSYDKLREAWNGAEEIHLGHSG